MKCSACKKKACNWKYENRDDCLGKKEGIECSCTCQVSDLETFVTSAASIVGGVALIGGGVALVANPVGIATAPLAGACIGGGASMIATPFINKANGEQMTFGNSTRNFMIGAGVGS